jgi:TPR repeat protein
MAMMFFLGQHGQTKDILKAVTLLEKAAANADENAPQGAYVSTLDVSAL